MESTAMAIVFIIGKAAIWLVLPLLLGIYELVRHRRRMAAEARGEAIEPSIPRWLQATPRQAMHADAVPAPAPSDTASPRAREAAAAAVDEPRKAA